MAEVHQPGAPLPGQPAVAALRALLDASAEGLLAVDASGRVVAWSAALAELGGPPAELREGGDAAAVLARLLAGTQAPEAEARRLAFLLAHPERPAEDLLRFTDGRRWARRCRPWAGPGGPGQLWAFADRSREARPEPASSESEARYRALAERTPALLHTLDPELRLTSVSDAWLARLGYTRGEVLGRRSTDFLSPASREQSLTRELPELLRKGTASALPLQFLTRAGEPVEVLLSAVAERDAEGRLVRVISVLSDVTERKRLEAERDRLLVRERAAREEAQRAQRRTSFLAEAGAVLSGTLEYRATLSRLGELCVRDLADWCVIDVVEDGRLQREGGAHADPAKRPLLEELGRRFPPQANGGMPIPTVLNSGRPLLIPDVSGEVLVRFFKDPEHRELIRALGAKSAMVVPLSVNGRVLGSLSLVSGRPERRYTEQDLELARLLASRAGVAIDHARLYREATEAIGLRDVFLMVASHELKTPLTPLSLLIQTLQRKVARGEPVDADFAAKLERPLRRLTGLINDLLDVSRIQAGKLLVIPAPTPLRSLVRELVDAARLASPDRQVTLEEPPGELVVRGDRARLAQVISNLLENAVKYSPEGSPIRVALRAEGREARLSVSDRGIGIPPEQRESVFERFFRAQNAPSTQYGGLGLGLYISRDVVERHGGRIWVESELGRGSTFHVALPLAPAPRRGKAGG